MTGSTIPKRYWTDLKKKLKAEGCQLYEKIIQLKMEAADGNYFTNKLQSTVLYEMKSSITDTPNNDDNMKLKIKIKDKNKSVTLLMNEFKNHLLIVNKKSKSYTTV